MILPAHLSVPPRDRTAQSQRPKDTIEKRRASSVFCYHQYFSLVFSSSFLLHTDCESNLGDVLFHRINFNHFLFSGERLSRFFFRSFQRPYYLVRLIFCSSICQPILVAEYTGFSIA